MDPITTGVISGLAVKAITSIAGPVGRLVTKNKINISPKVTTRIDLQAKNAVPSLLSRLEELKCSPTDKTKIAKFLHSEDAEVFVRTLMTARLTGEFSTFRQAFTYQLAALLALIGGLPNAKAEQYAVPVLNVLVDVCDSAVKLLEATAPTEIERIRQLAWHEARAGCLKGLSQTARMLNQWTAPELAQYYNFVTNYSRQIHNRYRYIIPPHLDDKQQIPIEDLYISPTFTTGDARFDPLGGRSSDEATLTFDRVLRRLYRTVVLGDPGAGKSTLAQKLSYEFSSPHWDSPTTGDRSCIPFLITLREYSSQKRISKVSIVQFISSYVNSEFGVIAPDGAIEYLLVSGRALVIFDGLDELLETHRRRDITDAIESFGNLYPYSSILVTSRKVGYREAPLNPEVFGLTYLAGLDEDSISEYVAKWFSLDKTIASTERSELVDAFLRESQSVSDLRSNPLMLGLLCNVYRGVRSIPRNRADLYEKCALMLFERWDSSRGILAPGPLKADAKYALQHLALWMYSSEGLASGVPHRRVVAEVGKYMLKTRFEDPARAEEAAKRFVELWRGRAWVLTDTGSTGLSEPIYQFTHRTFLEYFAAVQLVRKNPTPHLLWKRLHPHLRMREWDMVAQLSIQVMNYSRDNATDEMFQQLLRSSREGTVVERIHLLSFAARYLDTLAPSPKVCRQVAQACVELFLEGHPSWRQMPTYDRYISSITDYIWKNSEAWEGETFDTKEEELTAPLLAVMMSTAGDISRIANDEIVHYCSLLVGSGSNRTASKALTLALNLEKLMQLASKTSDDEQSRAAKNLVSEVQSRIPGLAQVDFWVPLSAARLGLVPLAQVVRWHGLDPLFCRMRTYPFLYQGGDHTLALAETIVRKFISAEPADLADLSEQEREDIHVIADAFRTRFADGRKRPSDGLDADWLGIDFAEDSELYRYVRVLSKTHQGNVEEPGELTLEDWDLVDGEALEEQGSEDFVDEMQWDLYWEPFDMPQRKVRAAHNKAEPVDPEVLFCGAALLAVFVELEYWRYGAEGDEALGTDIDDLPPLSLGCLQELAPVFMARNINSLYPEARVALGESALTDEDKAIIGAWLRRRLSFEFERTE